MANFTVEFPLKTEKYQEDILNKRFEIGRQIYNSFFQPLECQCCRSFKVAYIRGYGGIGRRKGLKTPRQKQHTSSILVIRTKVLRQYLILQDGVKVA